MSKTVTRPKYKKSISLEKQGFSSFHQKLEGRKWCHDLDTKPEIIETWVKRYGFDVVQATILEAKRKHNEGKIYKSLFGWVRAALQAKHTAQINNW